MGTVSENNAFSPSHCCSSLCRALDLSLQHKTHTDTVLLARQRYLKGLGREETDPRFKELATSVHSVLFSGSLCCVVQVTLDPKAIAAKEQQELATERQRGTAYDTKIPDVTKDFVERKEP